MDEFGVLTERFGLKPQGKSAPMASVKRPMSTDNGQMRNLGLNSGFDTKSSRSSWNTSNSGNGSFLDDHDSFYRSGSNLKTQNYGGLDDFGDFSGFPKANQSGNHGNGSVSGHNSIFTGSSNSGSKSSAWPDDIFSGMPGTKGSTPVHDDPFASFASNPKQSAPIDDLLGNLDSSASKLKSSSWNGSKNVAGFEDLIPGFGGYSPQKNSGNSRTDLSQQSNYSARSNANLLKDPFIVLESTSSPAYASSDMFSDALEQLGKFNHSGGTKPGGSPTASPLLRPPPKPAQVFTADKVKRSGLSSIDELEDFARGKVRNNAGNRKDETSGPSRFAASTKTDKTNFDAHPREVKERQGSKAGKPKEAANAAQQNQPKVEDDLESFFSMGSRSHSVPRSRPTTSDPVFDAQNRGEPKVSQKASSRALSGNTKASLVTADELFSMFGEASPVFGEFQEVEGESEERRRARLGRQQRTQQRAAKAVADMNQRDLQTQKEQEERRMIAETVDIEIKRWSAGKEGNMRALLSSLHYVLWTECGWQPVGLTDLITSGSVKKVYRKATLCIHPDKVQQRGANLHHKYTAEKVFDILKEAWNKFNKEELS